MNDELKLQPPINEPERQYYFMDRVQEYVEALSKKLDRPLTCCVNTFGCQMNPALEI